ncbi:MAG: Asp-tRNA(Asn)/Glu-tRNA(Gln) amidotransferase subunit GatB [Planctomycetes bacterium]|nr:Asp-tRNA(Asn)/Glu-tRNA(Gln) amidotransferase subunit GatB [Planctomycetota bacterium]
MSATPGYVSKKTGVRWVPVIGLEVHCQLGTRTKLFCGCEVQFGSPPNSLTCAVCTAQPGTLPVLNREALELAVRAALALGCEVRTKSKFDRKNYFYCDLPKGYQISQYDEPYCTGGGIQLSNGRFIRLTRIHMEEDAGKAIHDRGSTTLVDLNRAGVPLIESVTEADVTTAAEAVEYLTTLKAILQYVGVSDCDMEKGELRCDVNISMRPEGEPWRTKVEIKNLNSFRFVEAAIEHEAWRQIEAYESGDPKLFPVQETRLWDPARNVTRTMRSKESAHDYRYFAEPDLPPVTISKVEIERLRGCIPELPHARRERYQKELGLSAYDAGVLTASRALADFFEVVARLSQKPKDAANWIANDLAREFADATLGVPNVDAMAMKPNDLAELIRLVDEGAVNVAGARKVLRVLMKDGGRPKELVKTLGLEQVQDEGQLEAWCKEALVGKEKIVADVKAGKTQALNALLGPVMKASKGTANPERVKEILLRLVQGA